MKPNRKDTVSFSGRVKQELCSLSVQKNCCRKAELAGILAFGGMMRGETLVFRTENEEVIERLKVFLSELYGIQAKEDRAKRTQKSSLYVLSITAEDGLKSLLVSLGMYRDKLIRFVIDPFLTQETCCAQAFLRGAFLGGGSMSAPERSYHFEIETHYFGLSRDLSRMLSELDFEAKTIVRKSNYVTYLKGSEKIGDILGFMGATDSMMELYNTMIEKSVNNSVNRQMNCDSANLDKTIQAAQTQIAGIRRLVSKRGAEAIPENLRELADLRLTYPEASIAELAEMLSEPISKSGVNHRLRKLLQLAEKVGME